MNGNKLPDFFMLGVQKAATSTFHKILNQDSDFSLPYKKETHFFSENFNQNLNWYLNQYNNRTYKIRGEIDPSYIYYKKTPQNIKKYITDPKFIIIFRKPIDRAYSHYLMSKSRGYENETFNNALDLENKRLENGSKFSFSHHSYLSRGLYALPKSINSLDHLKNLFFTRTRINGEIQAQKIFNIGYFHTKGSCLNLLTSTLEKSLSFKISSKEGFVKGVL